MKTEKLKTKSRIIIEYPKDDYASIYREDLEKLHLRIFLKNGKDIFVDDIQQITLKLK